MRVAEVVYPGTHALFRHNNSEGESEEFFSDSDLSILISDISVSFVCNKNVEKLTAFLCSSYTKSFHCYKDFNYIIVQRTEVGSAVS